MSKIKFIVRVFILLFLILNAVVSLAHLPAEASVQTGAEEDEETVIIKYKPGVDKGKKKLEHARRQARVDGEVKELNAEVVKIKRSQLEKTIAQYKKDADVEYVEPDYILRAFSITNDPSLSQEWGMFKIEVAKDNATSAWDNASGSGAIVAVLDTGIDETHPDLIGKVVASQNFSSSVTTNDIDGHGSHVAGIIAANANDNQGVAGVAYAANLMNVKVLGDDGSGRVSSISSGIIWATDNGAKVINMSLGGPNSSITLQDAINYAWDNGVIVVAAAGNEGVSSPSYPAYYENVIAVAATDSNDVKTSWSNYGTWVDVAAPGASIYSTYKNSGYATLSGTSMASPHVAGLAGLVWSYGECLTNACVRSKIETTADNINGTGSDWTYGRINALKAVSGANVPPPDPIVCETSADTDADGLISNLEILPHIRDWKFGFVSNLLVLKAIKFWKQGSGC